MSYCQYVLAHPDDELNRIYHDAEYGYPVHDDDLLFERLVLEINQAGLSWALILKKKENFNKAFHLFDLNKIAQFGEDDFSRLMNDKGIIRNRLKINAAIENARIIKNIQNEVGSFKNWLDSHANHSLMEWVKLFKGTFLFTGEQIVGEFLISTGYLSGAHDVNCPVYKKIQLLYPAWMDNSP
ncbi:DNA-3-methyladenine glycosylase I [Chloroflexota bacterium]